jgi:Fur family ferric uptake transcriptional regulator
VSPKRLRKSARTAELSGSPALSEARDVRDVLRKAGLRSTGPRVAVLRWLSRSTSPVSHPELFEALAGEGFDRATLYRNLVDLAEAGIVRRTDLGDHVWRYELRASEDGHVVEHPHFVCTDCGEVACLPGVAVKIVATGETPRSVRSRKVAVQLSGRCNACG